MPLKAVSDPSPDNVQVTPEGLAIQELLVSDPTVVALFTRAEEEGADLARVARDLLVLGSRASALTGATKEAAALDVAVEQARTEITRVSQGAATQIESLVKGVAAPDGRVLSSIDRMLDDLSKEIDEAVAGEDAPLRTAINKTMAQARGDLTVSVATRLQEHQKVVADLLDPTHPTSPLRSVRSDLERLDQAVAGIRTLLDRSAGAQEVADRSTAKGAPYEEFAVAELSEVAAASGDLCQATGAKQGRSRKSGDAVVEIDAGLGGTVKLVMEAKSGAMTADAWRDEAAKSLKNREAQVFLGMAASEAAMPMPGIRVWVDEPHLMVVLHEEGDELDLLRTVVHLLRVEAISVGSDVADVDLVDLRRALSDGLKELEAFEKLQRSLASALKNVQSAQDGATSIHEAIRSRLAAALTALQGEGAEDAEDEGDDPDDVVEGVADVEDI